MKGNKIFFITGTDTGAGKTLLTAMLVRHLRDRGVNALAIKPFCSGSFDDVDLLRTTQDNALTRAEIAPFYFTKPLAPLAALPKSERRRLPGLTEILSKIREIQGRCDVLLVEGSGGLMVPLSLNLFVVDLIRALRGGVLLVARDRLGTINHTLLSIELLKKRAPRQNVKVVLMGQRKPDLSAATNAEILRDLAGTDVLCMKFLGENANKIRQIRKNCRKFQKTLAQLL